MLQIILKITVLKHFEILDNFCWDPQDFARVCMHTMYDIAMGSHDQILEHKEIVYYNLYRHVSMSEVQNIL